MLLQFIAGWLLAYYVAPKTTAGKIGVFFAGAPAAMLVTLIVIFLFRAVFHLSAEEQEESVRNAFTSLLQACFFGPFGAVLGLWSASRKVRQSLERAKRKLTSLDHST